MKLSACIELMFTEAGEDAASRVEAAARAGLDAVEFWLWRNKDLDALERALDRTGMVVTGFMSQHEGLATPTEWLVDPGRHRAFLAGLRESIPVAHRLGSPVLVTHSGDRLPGVDDREQRDAMVEALREAAPIVEDAGLLLLVEPLNTRVDHPGHFLDDTVLATEIVREVDHPSVRLMYDLYHSVAMGEVPERVVADIGLVGEVQIADCPGRHEPGSGTIDWRAQVDWLRRVGYEGYLGLEYAPAGDSAASLEHLRSVLA
jgi:hydroxypyruvate isomerase